MKYILTFIVLVLFIICVFQHKQINTLKIVNQQKVDSLTHVADSLHWELFPVQVELGRYEVAYRIFMERNPKAAEQYGTIISEETE